MIKTYPIAIEAVDELDELVFKLTVVDAGAALLEAKAIITPRNVQDFCEALQRALMRLELDPQYELC